MFFNKKVLLILILLKISQIFSIEFVYPIATSSDNKYIYFMYQKSFNNLELLLINLEKGNVEKILEKNFLPGAVKIIPDSCCLSFIDNGKLRIKSSNNTINTINLGYVYDINYVEWIDKDNYFFSAKKNNHNCIFKGNLNNTEITCLKEGLKEDNYLFPQKINEKFYFIKRTINENYRTQKNYFKVVDQNDNVILNFNSNPISFLNIISEDSGFFIEHSNLIDRYDKTILFSYYYFNPLKQDDYVELFTYSLPMKYLFGESDERLYESILPFLPKYHNNKIYFCNCSNSKNLSIDIFCYNIKTQKINQLTNAIEDEIFFSPIIKENMLYYGKSYYKTLDFNDLNCVLLNQIVNLSNF